MDIHAMEKENAIKQLVMDYGDNSSDSSDSDGTFKLANGNQVSDQTVKVTSVGGDQDTAETLDGDQDTAETIQPMCSDLIKSPKFDVDLEDGEILSEGEEDKDSSPCASSQHNTIEDADMPQHSMVTGVSLVQQDNVAQHFIVEDVDLVQHDTVKDVSDAQLDHVQINEKNGHFVKSPSNEQKVSLVPMETNDVITPMFSTQGRDDDDSVDSSEDSSSSVDESESGANESGESDHAIVKSVVVEVSDSSADESDDSYDDVEKSDDSDADTCPPKAIRRDSNPDGVVKAVKKEHETTVRCTKLICEKITQPVPMEKVDELVSAFCNYRKEDDELEDSLSSSGSISDIDSELADVNPAEVEIKRKELLLKKFPRTKGELLPEDLPALEELQIDVGDDVKMSEVGKVTSIVGVLVVVQSLEGIPPLNDDTILFKIDKKALGKVFETFGPIALPLYSIRFNSADHIKQHEIEIGMSVFCAPTQLEWTRYVFIEHLKRIRGCDASWENNNEPPYMYQDYSDDETEKRALSTLRYQGIRVTKTGEVQAPPDWETFKKDYPSAKQARKAYKQKYRIQPLTTERLLLTSWPPPPPSEVSQNHNKRPHQNTARQRPVTNIRQHFNQHPNVRFNRSPGGEMVRPTFPFPYSGHFPGNVPPPRFNSIPHGPPPGPGNFRVPPPQPTFSSANFSSCSNTNPSSMANVTIDKPPHLPTAELHSVQVSVSKVPKSSAPNDSDWHPIVSTAVTVGSTVTVSSFPVPPPPSPFFERTSRPSLAFPMPPFSSPSLGPPRHAPMPLPPAFRVPPPPAMMQHGSSSAPHHLPGLAGLPHASIPPPPPNVARFPPPPLPFGPPRFGVPPNFGYM